MDKSFGGPTASLDEVVKERTALYPHCAMCLQFDVQTEGRLHPQAHQLIQHHVPENLNLQHCCENLKSCVKISSSHQTYSDINSFSTKLL